MLKVVNYILRREIILLYVLILCTWVQTYREHKKEKVDPIGKVSEPIFLKCDLKDYF